MCGRTRGSTSRTRQFKQWKSKHTITDLLLYILVSGIVAINVHHLAAYSPSWQSILSDNSTLGNWWSTVYMLGCMIHFRKTKTRVEIISIFNLLASRGFFVIRAAVNDIDHSKGLGGKLFSSWMVIFWRSPTSGPSLFQRDEEQYFRRTSRRTRRKKQRCFNTIKAWSQ